jgi:hypothetical protein
MRLNVSRAPDLNSTHRVLLCGPEIEVEKPKEQQPKTEGEKPKAEEKAKNGNA